VGESTQVTRAERYSRNELLFGKEGQERVRSTHVAVVGVGGLGSHVVQQLTYLGVERLTLIDADIVEESNLNRLIGATPTDVGQPKVTVGARLVTSINPAAQACTYVDALKAEDARGAVGKADVVFGCVDRDLARLELTNLSSHASRPYFDAASDSGDDGGLWYGGRIVFSNGDGCLSCLGLLDQKEITRDSLSPELRAAHDTTYGLDSNALDRAGPSVVSVNGVVASLVVTLFLEFVAGIQEPPRHLIYLGEKRTLRQSVDPPKAGCFYCGRWHGGSRI
jgi:molybdopterin/thiamine biosynthesis adenylyltransferase